MIITSCNFTNFGSYPELNLNLEDLGLALIQGKTGAGKSTIMDAVLWGIFGITAKDGKADDVRPWNNTGDTTAKINIETSALSINITRIRGLSSSVNDLYFTEGGKERLIRGKDATETQKLICSKLGLDSDIFIAGSYYNEFSPTAAFFTARAKDRRDLFEKLANLDLPSRLNLRATEIKKKTKSDLQSKQQEQNILQGKGEQNTENLESAIESFEDWEIQRAKNVVKLEKAIISFDELKEKKLKELKEESENFEYYRTETILEAEEKINSLLLLVKEDSQYTKALEYLDKPNVSEATCKTCGQQSKRILDAIESKRKLIYKERHENTTNIYNLQGYEESLQTAKKTQNIHEKLYQSAKEEINSHQEHINTLKSLVNPWAAQQEKLADIAITLSEKLAAVSHTVKELESKINSLQTLSALASELRGELLKNAISGVEESTNSYLIKHFDAEIKVSLAPNGADDLEVTIHKSGHECSYKQLSKGQRSLLKLCFSIAVMQALSSSTGIEFGNVFLDESLDGLDSDLKVKAFSLFQSLNASSVLVIDHDENFKNLFERKFEATLQGDYSTLNEES